MERKEETVLIRTDGRITFLEFNRPKVFNALNIEMINELLAKLRIVKESDSDILIITGKGKGFSAGGDINTMVETMDKETFYSVMDKINEMITILYTMPKLVISAVHGAAAGLGFSIALAADYILAENSTVFAMNFIQIGLIADGGGHFFLKNRLGEVKAKQVIWEGKNISAEDAVQIGLINEVTKNNLLETSINKAEEWLHKPVKAMIETKKILSENSINELLRVLEMEKESQFLMRQTADHQEGIKAFLEKRKAEFTGR